MKRMGYEMQSVMDKIAIAIFAITLPLVGVNLLAGCAGWGKTTCQIVDAASQACTVIRFMGDDGKPHEVRLTPEEANEFGKSMAAKKAAAKAAEAEKAK